MGERSQPYESRVSFLKELFTLLDDDGIIVMSVPKMVGIPFLLQRVGLALFGLQREPISYVHLLKASFLNDTTELERNWDGDHLGFNHLKLEPYLKKEFDILTKKDIVFQMLYVITKKTTSS